MVKYKYLKDGIEFVIDFTIQQNFISIQGKININYLTYSLMLSLRDLHNKHYIFQKCNSLQEALELFIIFLNDKKGFIKEINNSEIILGIHDQNNDDILFNLIKKPFNNNNQNPSSINNLSKSMTSSNPMANAFKNIHFNEGIL